VGEEIVPATSLGQGAGTVRGLLDELDGDGLAALGERAPTGTERLVRHDVRLLAPVPDPEKIICMGLNYRDHAEEAHQEIPEHPRWFAKFANSLIGDGAEILLPDAHPDCSRTMTLVPGDIIATGTPAGVGGFRGRFLRDGQTVQVEVGSLGAVTNPVRREPA
jgi:2-keto-4-pentenoate hydratase/2-oxohepta-3-ene-1,7-dioic acid hydratase in catechol pathway